MRELEDSNMGGTHGGHVVQCARPRDRPLRPHVDGQTKVCASKSSIRKAGLRHRRELVG